jgi:L-fucose isomerase-like protein
MQKRNIKIGFAPTRRTVFSPQAAGRQKQLIETQLRAWDMDYIGLDWLNEEGLLYDESDARRVAERFRAEGVDALFVPHCNFGTEAAIGVLARVVGKPVLLWGPRDEAPTPEGVRDRDTQCGLFATSKVLRRMNVPFTYVVNSRVDDPVFERGFRMFLGAVAAARSFLGARIGQISTRPGPFWTVMVNEGELLERWGIQVVPTTMVDVERATKKILAERPPELAETIADFKARVDFSLVQDDAVATMAALKLALLKWVKGEELDAVAIQCWSAMQAALGIFPCFVNGELTALGVPVACETDIHGALTSLMAQAAALWATPTFFADLTVRHPMNDNAELLWHCGPFPYDLRAEGSAPSVSGHAVNPTGLPGPGNWEIRGGDITLARFDGDHGQYSLLMGHARGTTGPYTRGTYLWVEVDNWPAWEEKFIYGPYIHHCTGVHGQFAPVLYEACKYIPGLEPDPLTPTEEEIRACWRGQDLEAS